jgi:hypothetical protein
MENKNNSVYLVPKDKDGNSVNLNFIVSPSVKEKVLDDDPVYNTFKDAVFSIGMGTKFQVLRYDENTELYTLRLDEDIFNCGMKIRVSKEQLDKFFTTERVGEKISI